MSATKLSGAAARRRSRTIQTSFQMPEQIWKKLEECAERYCVSKSSIVSMAIVEFHESHLTASQRTKRTKIKRPEPEQENEVGNGHARVLG